MRELIMHTDRPEGRYLPVWLHAFPQIALAP